ncbi:MAG: hypothetical protein KDD43_04755 [Bdellovibrionales bacterium]|nr:hypothetical protein [Bdellovibrionales bacterium]
MEPEKRSAYESFLAFLAGLKDKPVQFIAFLIFLLAAIYILLPVIRKAIRLIGG